jgi:Flp pilus assembly protein TadD
LLDTRAKVLLFQNRNAEALRQLEAITARWSNTEPNVYFHLAMAYDRSGRGPEARDALELARERGLDVEHLTPGDRAIWLDLDQRLTRAVGGDGEDTTP